MDIQTLVQSIKLSDYIGQYCELTYKDGEYWCLSPFSGTDTDPSFSIRDEDCVFYDFSDGNGGNILTFIQKYHKVSFPKALRIAADFAGIKEDIVTSGSGDILKIMKQFAPSRKQKEQTEHIILAEDFMERYDPDAPQLSIWEDEGISREAMRHFNVRYDCRNERIVYPVKMPNGNIISVAGRTIHKDYKEQGLRKYTYYQKIQCADFLLGYPENEEEIMRKREIIVFEGIKSVLLAWGFGYRNCVAISTSHVSPEQMSLLLKLGCSVVFALDKGIDITVSKNIKKLRQFVPVYYIKDTEGLIDDKEAPVDRGVEVFEELYKGRRRLK